MQFMTVCGGVDSGHNPKIVNLRALEKKGIQWKPTEH